MGHILDGRGIEPYHGPSKKVKIIRYNYHQLATISQPVGPFHSGHTREVAQYVLAVHASNYPTQASGASARPITAGVAVPFTVRLVPKGGHRAWSCRNDGKAGLGYNKDYFHQGK